MELEDTNLSRTAKILHWKDDVYGKTQDYEG